MKRIHRSDAMINQLASAVTAGDAEAAVNLTKTVLCIGADPQDVLHMGLLKGMRDIGDAFRHNQVYVPQVMLAGMAMREAMDALRPSLVGKTISNAGKVMLATCFGDVHDLGKVLVGIMLEGAGFEVLDLGVDVSPDRIVEAIREHKPHIVGLAAGMTTTLPCLRWTVRVIEGSGLRSTFKLLLGGMPTTRELASELGADGYAADASLAVVEARRLMLGNAKESQARRWSVRHS